MLRTIVKTIDSQPGMNNKIRERIERLRTARVTVGVHEDAGRYSEGTSPPDVVEVALWNEFGTQSIPERSFIRSAIDGNTSLINKWVTEAIDSVVFGRKSVRSALEIIGFRTQVLIQNKIKSNVPPPNAESTIAAKKRHGVAPVTLMDTQLLLRSITYKVYE